MTSTLKRTALAVLGLIVLQLAVLGTAAAQQMDPPALPHQFYGTVTVNGVAAPDGTRVSAEVNGVEAKASSTGTIQETPASPSTSTANASLPKVPGTPTGPTFPAAGPAPPRTP